MRGRVRAPRTLRARVELLVWALLLLLLVSAAGNFVAQRQVVTTQQRLRGVLRPAQVQVANLTEDYVDQETGARGYQLTHDPVFLQPYEEGRAEAATLQRELARSLQRDKVAQQLLAHAGQAAQAWVNLAAGPEIAQQTPQSQQSLLQQELTGKRLFDELRSTLARLSTRINEMTAAEVAAIDSAQAAANSIAVAAGLAGAILALVATITLRHSLSRPLARLVAGVQRAADGQLSHRVEVSSPLELSTVAGAVETMRVRILAQTARAGEVQRRLDLAVESERIAAGLHDVVIRRLSSAGLLIQSAASRHPGASAALSSAVDEIDAAIRGLRRVIFDLAAGRRGDGLRDHVLRVVRESEPHLGFTPQLEFGGVAGAPPAGRAGDELIAALREILSDMARQPPASKAEIRVDAVGGTLRLHVVYDRSSSPAGPAGGAGALDALPARAGLLGGRCAVEQRPEGTVIDWAVPMSPTEPGPRSAG